jgi:two-component system sensor histidine kinase KdpD
MMWKLFLPAQTSAMKAWWKRGWVNLIVALFAVALFIFSLLVLPKYFPLGIILLFYLFIVLGLVYTGGIIPAIGAALVICLILDYLIVSPSGSFLITHSQDAWGLLIFLVFAILLSLSFSHLRNRIDGIRQQKDEERIRYQEQLREQSQEISRKDHQMDIFYNVMQETRDEKDLRLQLARIAQTINEAFAVYGMHDCLFLLPDAEELPFLNTFNEQVARPVILSSDEKASMLRVMQEAQPAMILDAPEVFHEKGSYVRRIVGSNKPGKREMYRYIYMVPLISGRRVLGESGQKVLGVMRVLIEDDGNPELHSLKKLLDLPVGSSTFTTEPELFSKLLDHAVFLIEQALIERGLMRQESMNEVVRRRAEEMQSAILSSVSHDFHTPLTQIKGAASGLLNQNLLGIEKEEHRQMLKDIVSEANWLERVVMRMLDLSRIENGALKIEKELYPFEQIIRNTLDLGHMRLLVKERQICLDIPDELAAVEVDPVLIGQVMVNLLENAIRYTPPASPIEVSARSDSHNLVVTVADHGPGIPAIELERIFGSFYQVKSRLNEGESIAQHQGSGLGLAVCRGFVEAHGGRIWAVNRESGGVKFLFTLPLPAAERPDTIYEENPRR